MLKCPKCTHEQSCPCKTCQARQKTEKPWVDLPNYIIACGNCGFTMHAQDWEDLNWAEYKQTKS